MTRTVEGRLAPAEEPGRETSLYRMFVRDLTFACRIGVHAHEHEAPQRVRINVDMWVQKGPAPLDDDIAKVVSYEDIVAGIERLAAKEHIMLVETAAERIAHLCLEDRRVARVRVKVEKLDVYTNAAAVGVEIERGQSFAAPPGTLPFPPPSLG